MGWKQQYVEIEGLGTMGFPSHYDQDRIANIIETEIMPQVRARETEIRDTLYHHERVKEAQTSIIEEEESTFTKTPHGFYDTLKGAGYFTEDDFFDPGQTFDKMQEGGVRATFDKWLGNMSTYKEADAYFKRYGTNVLREKVEKLEALEYGDPDYMSKRKKLDDEIAYIKGLANQSRRIISGDKSIKEAADEMGEMWGKFTDDPLGTMGEIAEAIWDDPGAFAAALVEELNKDPVLVLTPLGAKYGIALAIANRTRALMKLKTSRLAAAKSLKEARKAVREGKISKVPTKKEIFEEMAAENMGKGKRALIGAASAATVTMATEGAIEYAKLQDETGEIDYGELAMSLGPMTFASIVAGGVAGMWMRGAARSAQRLGKAPGDAERAVREAGEASEGVIKGAPKTADSTGNVWLDEAQNIAKKLGAKDPQVEALRILNDVADTIKNPSSLMDWEGAIYKGITNKTDALVSGSRWDVDESLVWKNAPGYDAGWARKVTQKAKDQAAAVGEEGPQRGRILSRDDSPMTDVRAKRVEKALETKLAKGEDVFLEEHVLKAAQLDKKLLPEILEGKKVALTGKITNATRAEAKEIIETFGGKLQSNVNKQTDILITGKQAKEGRISGKQAKAEELGIDTLDGDMFDKLVQTVRKMREEGMDIPSQVGTVMARMFPDQAGRTTTESALLLSGIGLGALAGWKLESDDTAYVQKAITAAVLGGVAGLLGPTALRVLAKKLHNTERPTFHNIAKQIKDDFLPPPHIAGVKTDLKKARAWAKDAFRNYKTAIAMGTWRGKMMAEELRKMPGMDDASGRIRLSNALLTTESRHWDTLGLTDFEKAAAKKVELALNVLAKAAKDGGHLGIFHRTLLRNLFNPSKKEMAALVQVLKKNPDNVLAGIRAIHHNPNLASYINIDVDASLLVAKAFEAGHAAGSLGELLQALTLKTEPGISPLLINSKGWKKIKNPEHDPELARYITLKDDIHPGLSGYRVHPDIMDYMDVFFQSRDPGDIMRALGVIAFTSKRLTVGGSLFHANVLFDSMAYAGSKTHFALIAGAGLGAGAVGSLAAMAALEDTELSRLTKTIVGLTGLTGAALVGKAAMTARILAKRGMSRPALLAAGTEAHGLTEDAVRAGIKFGMIEDMRNEHFFTFWRKAAQSMPVPGAQAGEALLEKGFRKLDDFMWDDTLTRGKLLAFAARRESLAKKNLKKGWGLSQDEMDRAIADFVNDAFGGLDWEGIAMNMLDHPIWKYAAKTVLTPRGRQVMQVLMFAPDWTISNLRIVGKSYKMFVPGFMGGTKLSRLQGRMHAGYSMRALAYTALTGMMVEAVVLGKDPMKYLDRKMEDWRQSDGFFEFMENLGRVDLGEGRRAHFNKQFTEVFSWGKDPVKSAIGKSSLFPKEVIELAANIEYVAASEKGVPLGPQLVTDDMTSGEAAFTRAKHVAGKFAPISLSAGEDVERSEVSGGEWWLRKGAGVLSGTAGVPVYGKPSRTRGRQSSRNLGN